MVYHSNINQINFNVVDGKYIFVTDLGSYSWVKGSHTINQFYNGNCVHCFSIDSSIEKPTRTHAQNRINFEERDQNE